MRKLLIIFLMSGILSHAAPDSELRQTLESGHWILGLGVEFLVSNQLPEFESTQMVLGPRLGIPLGDDHLVLGVAYGSGTGDFLSLKNIFMAEIGYRMGFTLPFLWGFFSAGAHYTTYQGMTLLHSKLGPAAALGFQFPMAKDFRMGVDMRGYLLENLILSFGGAFAFTL